VHSAIGEAAAKACREVCQLQRVRLIAPVERHALLRYVCRRGLLVGKVHLAVNTAALLSALSGGCGKQGNGAKRRRLSAEAFPWLLSSSCGGGSCRHAPAGWHAAQRRASRGGCGPVRTRRAAGA